MTWYNTYRPTDFDDVVGQGLVKSVLKNSLAKNKIKHAYLFNGSKGIGKTTLARIFASKIAQLSVNPEGSIDIVEMDAASNTGIDDVRELIESASNPPLVAPYKVYIIDEVHMLSKPAMNALLKILEEPPVHLVFLLATTNPEKLIPTVLSRLTKLNLTAHSIDGLVSRLKYIASKEGVSINDDALNLIAKRSGGSQRDAINLLETIASYELENYTKLEVARLLGLLPEDIVNQLCHCLISKKIDKNTLLEIQNTGIDGDSLLAQMLEFLLDESFAGRVDFDDLIMPVAEIIDLSLPLTSVISSLALLQVRIKNGVKVAETILKQPIPIIIPTPIYPETNNRLPELKEPEFPLVDSYFPESDSIMPLEEQNYQKSENLEPKKENQPRISQGDSAFTLKDIDDFIQSLNFNPTTPPLFKTFIPALMVESIVQNLVIIRAGNPFALNQIKNAKNKQWLVDTLKLKFSIQFNLELKEGKVEQKKTLKVADTGEFIPKLDTDIQRTNEQEAQSYIPNKGEIFYSVYGNLPKQLVGIDVPLITNIISPVKTSDDHWDTHIEDMFDLD